MSNNNSNTSMPDQNESTKIRGLRILLKEAQDKLTMLKPDNLLQRLSDIEDRLDALENTK